MYFKTLADSSGFTLFVTTLLLINSLSGIDRVSLSSSSTNNGKHRLLSFLALTSTSSKFTDAVNYYSAAAAAATAAAAARPTTA